MKLPADVRVGATKPQYSFDFLLTLSQGEWSVWGGHAWYLWEKERARKNDKQSVSLILTWVCFFQLLYLVLFSVGVILILFSILFSQISKWYSCIMITSALFSLLCHRGFVRFAFPCLFQVSLQWWCLHFHQFYLFCCSWMYLHSLGILSKKWSCQCFAIFITAHTFF